MCAESGFSSVVESFANDPEMIIGLAAVAGWIPVVIVCVVVGQMGRIARIRAVEQSRREIAAYVAEGTITPDEAERLLRASPSSRRGGCSA